MPRRATRVDDFPNRDVLDDIAFGLVKATVLKTAIELEIFTRIAEGHRTVPALAHVGGMNEHGTRVLLDALVFTGLLTKQHSEYKLSPTAEAFLVKGKLSYYGDAAVGDFAWDTRGQLSKVLRTGKPLLASAYGDSFEPMRAGFAASTLVDAQKQLETVGGLWDKLGLTIDGSKPFRVADVACGSGVLSLSLARRNPNVRVLAIDRPMVLTYAKHVAESLGMTSQFTFQPGDSMNPELRAESLDLVLFGNITGYLSPEQNIGLFRKAFEALVPNGRIVISAPVADEDHKGPGEVPLTGIEMLLFSPDGDIYTLAEYRGMLETVGFSEVTGHKDDWGLIDALRLAPPAPKQ